MKILNEETLFKTEWLSIKKRTTDTNGEYIYSHMEKSNGKGIAILPFEYGEEDGLSYFLGRMEWCPAHDIGNELCSITGMYDNADKFTIEECALNELREEAGLDTDIKNLIYLGAIRPSKSSDSTTYLFAVDMKKCKRIEATGDGTLGEVGAYCTVCNIKEIIECKDPLMATMAMRLLTMDDFC